VTYLDFYELTQEPFSNAPVSRFYYGSAQHAQALMRLTHAVSNMKGLAVLVGEIGAGKTTLARRMLDSLPEEEYEAALLVIIHSGITASWLLRRIALQLFPGVGVPGRGREEGWCCRRPRSLREIGEPAWNLEVPERKLISFVFFGLPDLEQHLKLDPPLAQRVALKYRLEALKEEDTEAYVRHRLRLAGASRVPFLPAAISRIHAHSHGTPRLINTICDNALFEGFVARAREIDDRAVDRVARDLGLEAPPPPAPAEEARPAADRPRIDLSDIDRYLESLTR
jgi:type II secretory pathway predicted ATPase ExeA